MYAHFEAETKGDRIDYETSVINANGSMVICAPDAPIYITKAQAMAFFGLTDPSQLVISAARAVQLDCYQ